MISKTKHVWDRSLVQRSHCGVFTWLSYLVQKLTAFKIDTVKNLIVFYFYYVYTKVHLLVRCFHATYSLTCKKLFGYQKKIFKITNHVRVKLFKRIISFRIFSSFCTFLIQNSCEVNLNECISNAKSPVLSENISFTSQQEKLLTDIRKFNFK